MVCFKISIYQSTELKLCGLLTVFCYFVNIFLMMQNASFMNWNCLDWCCLKKHFLELIYPWCGSYLSVVVYYNVFNYRRIKLHPFTILKIRVILLLLFSPIFYKRDTEKWNGIYFALSTFATRWHCVYNIVLSGRWRHYETFCED